MEAEFLEPVLPNHISEVVCHIDRCNKLTEVIRADVIVIIVTVFVLQDLSEVLVLSFLIFQEFTDERNQRERSVTCPCFKLIVELRYPDTIVLTNNVCLFTDSDSFLLKVNIA